ncbi:MAG: hypothetical protein M3Y48_01330 [Actinomycetota bacterium]|nr:hypothetical protein [Actinomycetota bacterium]
MEPGRSQARTTRQLKIIQQQVGHSWASTTAVYTTVGTDAKNRMLTAALHRAFAMDSTGGAAR